MAPHTDGVLQCRPDEGCRRVHDRRSLGRLGLVAKVDRRFVPKEPSELRVCRSDEGGDEGNRTPNPRLAKAVLCQLSYVPVEAVAGMAAPALASQSVPAGMSPYAAFTGRRVLVAED